ncbi:hypothetical protein TCE0_003f00017 [Talaromyces pinophilus]|uniref:Nuclear pore protein n=1 Tax=Talaromyces pinophilus TaxID=128442 RepID=A0A0B8N329_TALPI|nr:hypothetical protein TCE0_003f00017 [Talaromyces pinophilus]
MATGGFGGSLFGGNKGSSILGAGQPAQAGTSSLFSTNQQPTQQQSQPQQVPQNSLPPLAQSTQSAQTTQPAFFNSLLERGKKRPFATGSQDTSYGELPSLQLGLEDIRRKARELGGQDTKATRQPGRDQKAHYLLAASGISPGHALRDLKALDAQASIPSPFKQVEGFDPDNEKFMKSVQQRGRQAMVAESLARVHRDFDTFLEEKVNMNWDDQRRKIFQHFDHGDRGDVGAQGPDTRFLREKMGLFARKVGELNAARLEEKPYAIFHEFGSVEDHPAGDVPRQLAGAYQALISITGESRNVTSFGEPGAIKEREFAGDYLNELNTSKGATSLRKRIVEGSRVYLENLFYSEVEAVIAKNPREAQLGGIPSTINRIRAYIRLRAARKDLAPDGTELQIVGEDYCWILIFFLLRCGFVTEAAEYVSSDPGFRSLDHKFVTYMTTYAQSRRLPRDLQQKINGEYQQRLRNAPENTIDPYRMACYKIIGRCDLGRRRLDGVGQGVEDWMWLQFVLAREDDRVEEFAGNVFGLEDIQTDITEIGQRVFAKGQDTPGGYGTFFLLQILGGMFEQAISYLGSHAPVSAVHFAVALDYYGLLRVTDFYTGGEEILSFTTKQFPQINFAYLITQYTREFRTANVEAAIDYFALICLNADLPGALGKSQASVCHEALREFILETRDFAKLLGDIRADGVRIKGVIERRLRLIKLVDQDEFLRTITVQAATVADDKGLIADAVLLYHLAEDYDHVIEIVNRSLSDTVSLDLGQSVSDFQPLKPRVEQGPSTSAEPGSSLSLTTVDDPMTLARNMISLYNSNALYYQKIRQINRDACGLLLRMLEAKSQVEIGNWAPALDAINDLQILPLRAKGSVPYIRNAAQSFASLPSVISRNIGPLIIWSITCIGRERERLYAGAYENEIRQALAEELLAMAKDLMLFAGMIKYKLQPRVYETLARAGAEIGAF